MFFFFTLAIYMSYSIDQFSKITGISKLVLRTWENRYDYLKAGRTQTKLRYYSDELLVQALKTKFLIDSGYKISFISSKNDIDLDNLIYELKSSSTSASFEYYINKMIEAGVTYNTELFNKTYDQCLIDFNHIDFYIHVMLPTFSKIGLLWLTNRMNPAQEHFLSEAFKQKIYSEIDKITTNTNKKATWLLFLPPNEHHEIGLLFSRFLLLNSGYNVIYLGANVPLSSIQQVFKTIEINNILFFSIANYSKDNLTDTISFLSKNLTLPNKYIVTNAQGKNKLFQKHNITLIDSIKKFIKLISK